MNKIIVSHYKVKKTVVENISKLKKIYVRITEKLRIYVYQEYLGNKIWYNSECQILKNGEYVKIMSLSADNLEDLGHIVGICLIKCDEILRFNNKTISYDTQIEITEIP